MAGAPLPQSVKRVSPNFAARRAFAFQALPSVRYKPRVFRKSREREMKIAVVTIRVVKIAEEKFPELKIGKENAATILLRKAHL
jgi:hypothetical protein